MRNDQQEKQWRAVREKIAQEIAEWHHQDAEYEGADYSWEKLNPGCQKLYRSEAEGLLALPKIEVEAEDQRLPKELLSCGFGCEEVLKDWRRVVPK